LPSDLARWVPGYAYDAERFFAADDAPPEVRENRRVAFAVLAAELNARHARSIALTQQARAQIPDLQFTGAYRVPFQFSPYLRQHLSVGAFVQRTDGVCIEDLDGQRLIDLTGCYGVTSSAHDSTRAASRKAAPAWPSWAQCWAVTTRWWPAMWPSCAASRARTR
jgi:glutamate-1-semialdehyde 2,1-aminomutase